MDEEWLRRLVDRSDPPGSCALSDYVRLTRMLSGISSGGWAKIALRAAELQTEQRIRSQVLTNPDVISLLDLLKGLNVDEKIIVLDVIRRGLYPNDPDVPMFKAASIDPKAQPQVSLETARKEIAELEERLTPLIVPVQPRTGNVWSETASFDPDAFLLATCDLPIFRDREVKQEHEVEEGRAATEAVASASGARGTPVDVFVPNWDTRIFIEDDFLKQVSLKASECLDGRTLRTMVLKRLRNLHFGDAPIVDAKGRPIEDVDQLLQLYPRGTNFVVRLKLDTQLLNADINALCKDFPEFRLFELARQERTKVELVEETNLWLVRVLIDDIKLEDWSCELPVEATGKDLKDVLHDNFKDLMQRTAGVLTCNDEALGNDLVLAKALTRADQICLQFKGPLRSSDQVFWTQRYPVLEKFDLSLRPRTLKTFLYSVYIGDVLATSSSMDTSDEVKVETFVAKVVKEISSLLVQASTRVQLAVSETWLTSKDVLKDCISPEDDPDLRIFLKPQEVKALVPEDRLPLIFPEVPTKELNLVFGTTFLELPSEVHGVSQTPSVESPSLHGAEESARPKPKRRPTMGVPHPVDPPRGRVPEPADPPRTGSQPSHVAKRGQARQLVSNWYVA